MQDKLAKQTPIDDFVATVQTLKQGLGQGVTGRNADADGVGEQRLYERWLRQDEWRVRSEALPLLFGVEPSQWPELITGLGLRAQIEGAWDELKACIARAQFPPLIGTQREEEEWRVNPLDFYQWARGQGLDIPPAFERLAQFVATVIKRPHSPSPAPRALFGAGPLPQTQTSEREKILGAALNVLAKCPDDCRDEYGLVSGEAIVKLIAEQCIRWFDTPQLPADATEVAALIDRWLE
ncbi:MAG: hypothetical protein ACREV4_07215 [Gammaproteobacteria bacterium]